MKSAYSFFHKFLMIKILPFFFLCFLLGSILFFFASKEPFPFVSFDELIEQLFQEDVAADTLSLHYTLAFPAEYGIASYPLTLPGYNEDAQNHARSRIENILYLLKNINPSQLDYEERYTYYLLLDYLKQEQEGFSYGFFEEAFPPSSGIISQYPVLMAEYTFRTHTDVTDYLALLAQTGEYFSSLLEFQKKRADAGFSLPDVSLEQTILQCDTIITKEALDEESHFLQQTFRERILPLVAKEIISKEEAASYIGKNNQILQQIVLPAYEHTGDQLLLLKGSCTNEQGLCFYEQGKSYYSWLVQKAVGTNKSVPEMLQRLERDYDENLSAMTALQEKLYELQTPVSDIDNGFPLTDRNAILQQLQNSMEADFPSLSTLSGRKIETTIKSVSSCMEDYLSPAFYLIPPIDDMWNNVIYINEKETPAGLELFTTLAHEGYPGHLYQTVYYQLISSQKQLPDIRHLMNFEGYVEGWAIYAEFYSYDYAAALFSREEQELMDILFQFLSRDLKLQLSILSQLDIQLHYYGAPYDTAKQLLWKYGITDEETCQNVYQYILEAPGNYLKYYMGYLEILDLKEKAETLMGSAFSDYEFHKFFLGAGPSDFDNLEKRLVETYPSSSMDSR